MLMFKCIITTCLREPEVKNRTNKKGGRSGGKVLAKAGGCQRPVTRGLRSEVGSQLRYDSGSSEYSSVSSDDENIA